MIKFCLSDPVFTNDDQKPIAKESLMKILSSDGASARPKAVRVVPAEWRLEWAASAIILLTAQSLCAQLYGALGNYIFMNETVGSDPYNGNNPVAGYDSSLPTFWNTVSGYNNVANGGFGYFLDPGTTFASSGGNNFGKYLSGAMNPPGDINFNNSLVYAANVDLANGYWANIPNSVNGTQYGPATYSALANNNGLFLGPWSIGSQTGQNNTGSGIFAYQEASWDNVTGGTLGAALAFNVNLPANSYVQFGLTVAYQVHNGNITLASGVLAPIVFVADSNGHYAINPSLDVKNVVATGNGYAVLAGSSSGLNLGQYGQGVSVSVQTYFTAFADPGASLDSYDTSSDPDHLGPLPSYFGLEENLQAVPEPALPALAGLAGAVFGLLARNSCRFRQSIYG